MLSGHSIHQKRPIVYSFNHSDDNGIPPTTKDYQRILNEIELYNSTVDECDVVSRVKADELATMIDSVGLNTDERIWTGGVARFRAEPWKFHKTAF